MEFPKLYWGHKWETHSHRVPSQFWIKFLNYKGTYSIILLALVDNNYNLTCIDIGAHESMSDGGIFNKSSLKKAIEENLLDIPEDAVILGDEAFPFHPI